MCKNSVLQVVYSLKNVFLHGLFSISTLLAIETKLEKLRFLKMFFTKLTYISVKISPARSKDRKSGNCSKNWV